MASRRLIRQASTTNNSRFPVAPRLRRSHTDPSTSFSELEPLISHGSRDSPTNETTHPDDDAETEFYDSRTGTARVYRFGDLPVYANIWKIRNKILESIKDPYSLEQLRAPRLNSSLVRPLMKELYALDDISIVYCLLVNRVQFLRDQSYQAHYLSVSTARALLCELLALRILRQYDDDTSASGAKGLLLLANILIAGFEPFQNAPPNIKRPELHAFQWWQQRGGYERHMSALEIAIISESKLFLSSPAAQKVVDAVFVGRITYTPSTFIDILPDHYKHRHISLYDPQRASVLNQYRLNVPRTRNIIEILQFVILLSLYVAVLQSRNTQRFTFQELVFVVYTFGWILDQVASIFEHGWRVYTENLWTFLDVFFSGIFVFYFILRMHGISTDNLYTSQPALDILSIGAPFLIPRLAFNVFSENILFVSLREMMGKFLLLTLLAIWTFSGFFLSMLWLAKGTHQPVTIGKWMIWIWFGLDGEGLQRSVDFHWFLGPLLVIAFAIFGNTLFLTVVVSTLSTTFSNISKFSAAEIQFRRAVLTFEGVKSDALFFYQPPFNIIALGLLLPLKLIVTPRWFHKVNITLVRVLNAPLLCLISLIERRRLWPLHNGRCDFNSSYQNTVRSHNKAATNFSRFGVHRDIAAVFKVEPPEELGPRNDSLTEAQDTQKEPDTNSNPWGNVVWASRVSSPTQFQHQQSENLGDSTSLDKVQEEGSGGRKQSYPSRRRDTAWSTDGVEAQVAGLLQGDNDGLSMGIGQNEDLASRLSSLEESNRRIENLLESLTRSGSRSGGRSSVLDDEAEARAEADRSEDTAPLGPVPSNV